MVENRFYSPVSNYFRSKGIVLPGDNQWMQGCIDFCLSENPNQSLNEVQAFVFDQWLLADLCDVGVPCLPPNVENRHSLVLQGYLTLQVNEVMNIGQSSYSQLQKIRKVATENAEVSDNKPTTQAWEPKGGRMLRLTMTDGVQKVLGMEYKPINSLQEPFIPGFKIIVRGPVECRKGVLLLEEKQITVFGGEVDDLVVQNSLENLLLKSLNLETVANPANLIAPAQTQRAPVNEQSQHHLPSQVAPVRAQNTLPTNLPRLSNLANQPRAATVPIVPTNKNIHNRQPNNALFNEQINPECFDEFLDDDDDDLLAMHLDQVAAEENNAIKSSGHLLSDEDEDEALLQVSENLVNQKASSPLRETQNDRYQSHNYSYLDLVQPSSSKCDSVNRGATFSRNSQESCVGSRTSSSQRLKSHIPIAEVKPCSKIDLPDHMPVGPSQPNKREVQRNEMELPTLRLPNLPFLKRSASSPLKDSQEKLPSEKMVKKALTAIVFPASGANDVGTQSNLISSFFELFTEPVVPSFIKAKVVSLESKLKIKDRKWTLTAKISDGQEEIPAHFSPEVLEKLVGHPAADIATKRDEVEKDPVLKNQIRDILMRAKAKISTLEAKMKIELPALFSTPVVTEVIID